MLIFFILSYTLFFFGVFGLISNRKNLLVVLMSLEVIFFSLSFHYAIAGVYLDDIVGHLFCLYILTVAAAESAIGLALLVSCYKIRGNISMFGLNALKG